MINGRIDRIHINRLEDDREAMTRYLMRKAYEAYLRSWTTSSSTTSGNYLLVSRWSCSSS